jgi:hypothetical protein
VKLCLLPFRDRIFFELRQPVKSPGKHKEGNWKMRDWAMYSALPTVAKSLARALPIRQLRYPLIDNISDATQSLLHRKGTSSGSNATEQSGRYRTLSHDRFNYCTWAFPAADFANVVVSYKLFSREHYSRTGFRCDMPTVAFRLPRDRSSLLSPSFDGPLLTLSPLSTEAFGWEDFMQDFADFAMELGGIPFFNQTRNASPECVNRAFDKRLALFRKVREEFDPRDRLLNQFFATYMT